MDHLTVKSTKVYRKADGSIQAWVRCPSHNQNHEPVITEKYKGLMKLYIFLF